MAISHVPTKSQPADADVVAMLAGLPDGAAEVVYGKGEAIFRQGESADAVFYILKGDIQISVVSEQGKEGVIAILGAGDFFGEGCLSGQPLYLASAIALDQVAVVRIVKAAMVRALQHQAAFAEKFTAFLLMRKISVEADLVDQLFNSSEKRLARTLLLLAHFGKDGKMEAVLPKVSQEALAARVGTTRSRVNYFMNKFRRLGFIEYNGELKVHSSLMNVIVLDQKDAPKSRRALGTNKKPTKK
jgi:CRP/FNR family cyclic AMP-dependent transcriptional regulator